MTDNTDNKKLDVQQSNKVQKIRKKYRQDLEDQKYRNLQNVPPPLQSSSKRLIDKRGKGLGTTNKQRAVGVKFPPEMDDVLRSMKNRSDYIRRAVLEKMHKENLLTDYHLPEDELARSVQGVKQGMSAFVNGEEVDASEGLAKLRDKHRS